MPCIYGRFSNTYALEHWGLEVGACWQANADDSAAWADVLSTVSSRSLRPAVTMTYLRGLLEWLLVHGHENDCVWAKAVLGSRLDFLDNVLALGEVDEGVRAKLLHAHLLLVVTSVNGNRPKTHGLGVLLGERAKSATGTDNGDSLAWACTRLLQALVDGDTGTKYWSYGVERDVLVQPCDVRPLGDAVLLESAIDSVSGEQGL